MPTDPETTLPAARSCARPRIRLTAGFDEDWFMAILGGLVDKNALACRAVLKLAKVRFTTDVNTLAVTLTRPVELLVNLDFVRKHCRTEEHVEAVLLHEFLHVLLGHTERFERMNPALNLALDAVINAIIHRSVGPAHSAMMARYYADEKHVGRLLRPMTPKEVEYFGPYARIGQPASNLDAEEKTFAVMWARLYAGRICADDVLDLMESLADDLPSLVGIPLLGSHEPGRPVPCPELSDALGETMKQMNGHDIWRSPKDRGVGQESYDLVQPVDERMALWEKTAWRAIRRVLVPDRRGIAAGVLEQEVFLPVLSPRDRRGFLRALWSPLIPSSGLPSYRPGDPVSAHVYLDVSGSMKAEMPALIALLNRLRRWISMPFWAFSDVVVPARIEHGHLATSTTGGTSMNAVLRHVAATKPARALVVTDGYIERVDRSLLAACTGTVLHALVSRNGSTRLLDDAGIRSTQLEAYPGAAGAAGGPTSPGAPRPSVTSFDFKR